MDELSTVQSKWRQRGFSCDIWTDPPGQVWRDFVHGVDELLMLIEGDLEVSVGGQTWQPRIGEEVFIHAGAKHTVINIGATPDRWYYGYQRGP